MVGIETVTKLSSKEISYMLLYVLPIKYGKAQTRTIQQSWFLKNDTNVLAIQTYHMCIMFIKCPAEVEVPCLTLFFLPGIVL